jgi:mannose-1-phosphate guanylyltransferase
VTNRNARERFSCDHDGIRVTTGPESAHRHGEDEAGLWAVILAGGEGIRLRRLTRHVSGDLRPKQFVRLLGGRSLLRQTLDRTGLGISWDRTAVVAHRRHARYLAEEFADLAGPRVLMQPEDRGTAAAILLAAHWISWRNPAGLVAVFPSDHFIEGEAAFMGHVRAVAALACREPERLVLLGATATHAEPQYGWIELGAPLGQVGGEPLWGVRGFVEKPPADAARVAWARGDLWNTFVVIGSAATLLRLGWEALPTLSERLADIEPVTGTRQEPAAMAGAYTGAPAANFSRAILEPYSSALAVSRLPRHIRWSDWGTPERVIASLRAASLVPPWLRELDRRAAAPA